MKPTPIIIVQGAQWGSEAKGAIAARLCLDRNITYAVRTGAINAGHTVMFKGKKYAMQQIPTGWINQFTQLVIGPGAYIHPDTLWREIDIINSAMPEHDVRRRLIIDYRCGTHTGAAEDASRAANRHHAIGATGKGCSEAIVAKIRDRNNGYQLFAETETAKIFRGHGVVFGDTVGLLHRAYDDGARILIEGTQGTLLDLHLGPYPFTTSRMTTAANWIAEAGLSPGMEYETVLVVRTYPIRVAGNSGLMDNEIEWTDLAREMNIRLADAGRPAIVSETDLVIFESCLQQAAYRAAREDRYQTPIEPGADKFNVRLSSWDPAMRDRFRVAASELQKEALGLCGSEVVDRLRALFEMTTVTRKLRRLARMSISDLHFSIMVNRPSWIALTFLDYVFPALAGVKEADLLNLGEQPGGLPPLVDAWLTDLSQELGVPIKMASVGPHPLNVFDVDLARRSASGKR